MASSGTANPVVLDSAELKAVKAGGLIREDVMNKIFDISKIPLPFTDMIGSTTAKQEYIEWTTDELAQPNVANAVIDGSDITGNDAKTGERVGNHHQISIKAVQVSYRADASDTIGRAKELAYQLMRRQQELRRDVEAIALSNQASVADNGTTVAGKVGGLPSWLKTNAIGSASQGFNLDTKLTVAATAGTAAALKEADLRTVIQKVYEEGGDVSVMMSVPGIIAKFSEYMIKSKGATAQIHTEGSVDRTEPVVALGSVNVFVTDFGTIRAVPNRLQQLFDDGTAQTPKKAAAVFILDPQYLSLCYLKGYQTDELAKTGLSEKRVMSVDWSLIVHTEKAHGMIYGVDPTAAMVE
jgi:hypothetical protein